METIKIGNKEIELEATIPALLDYRKEFNSDLTADLMKLQTMLNKMTKNNIEALDPILVLQIIWVLNKNYNRGEKFPKFEKWTEQFEYIDFGSPELIPKIVNLGMDGFFRSPEPGGKPGEEENQKPEE